MAFATGDEKHKENAYKQFRKALEINPENTNATVNLGLVYKFQEHTKIQSETT